MPSARSMAQAEEKQPMLLPSSQTRSPTAYVAGEALISWHTAMYNILPKLLVLAAIGIMTFSPILLFAGLGPIVLYAAWLLVTYAFFKQPFQLWALQRPDNLLVRLLLPSIAVLEGSLMTPNWIFNRWGSNFCAAGQVWLGTYKDVAAALETAQARTFYLAEHALLASNMPDAPGRCVFLLSLSDRAATGTGDHEAFRQCVLDYVFTDAAQARETDHVSMHLLDELARDYAEMKPRDFYYNAHRGSRIFWVKYLHHVLFALDIHDPLLMAPLKDLHIGAVPMLHYMLPYGYIASKHAAIEKVAAIYAGSAALANFREGEARYNNMSKRELAVLMAAVMRLAGIQGSQTALLYATSGHKHGNLSMDARDHWDNLDLNDTAAVRCYFLECMRLSPPVISTCCVATAPFTCTIRGKQYNFARGTKVANPLGLAMTDKEHWGPDALDFNPNRANLESDFLGFNSVGGRHAGRECPAKPLVLRTMVRVLQVLGRTRRPHASAPQQGGAECLPSGLDSLLREHVLLQDEVRRLAEEREAREAAERRLHSLEARLAGLEAWRRRQRRGQAEDAGRSVGRTGEQPGAERGQVVSASEGRLVPPLDLVGRDSRASCSRPLP